MYLSTFITHEPLSSLLGDSSAHPSQLISSIFTVCLVTQSCPALYDLPRSSVYGVSPGKNTGVGCLSLLQGIFPTQGLNPDLPHCRHILYQLSHQGNPRILEWIAYPFARRSSWPRNRTRIVCIAGDSLPTELSGKPLIFTEHLLLMGKASLDVLCRLCQGEHGNKQMCQHTPLLASSAFRTHPPHWFSILNLYTVVLWNRSLKAHTTCTIP